MSFWKKRKTWQRGFLVGVVLVLVGWIGVSAVFYDEGCWEFGEFDAYGYDCSFAEFSLQVLSGSLISWVALLIVLISTLIGYIIGRREQRKS